MNSVTSVKTRTPHIKEGTIWSLRRAAVLAVLIACSACGSDRPRRQRAPDLPEVDSVAPTSTREALDVPENWQRVTHPVGLYFYQPPGFTFGLDAARLNDCDANTPSADVPVLDRGFLEVWPLTLAMRRGDVNQIARTNGFTLDSTEVASHEGGGTTVRRGEGWLLLSGRTDVASITFASVRAPGGCYLIWAARGMDINADTLGMVLSTLKFGSPP